MRDLSELHSPVGQLFPWPADAAAWHAFRLSDAQVAHFHQHGYVGGVRVLQDLQLAALREALYRLADPAHPAHSLFYEFHSNESHHPDTVLFHALGAWRAEEAFHDLLWNPAFLMPAAQLLGGPVRFWHDQLFSKPANHGGVVAWHQDFSYWTRTQPMAHLTCWIGLDDSTTENGCLQYIPGSHRWNLLPITGLTGNMDEIRGVLSPQQRDEFQPIPIELRAGECAFHHPLLVHGSYENRSPRPRRAAVVNVFRDGVRSASDEPLLEGVPAIPAGAPMQGQFFPLLFHPQAEGIEGPPSFPA
ncbi:MAG: phytanoyl-CoA dioxygenase family protein [Bryobacterales bacterium]|jgi:ectoine hydroxylase-related dioxygenase (phytanoyl-CoA dioxygenase family)|nr:phytanoyl-CoA dioxygenase family protein [Bryobacterales bacterium]